MMEVTSQECAFLDKMYARWAIDAQGNTIGLAPAHCRMPFRYILMVNGHRRSDPMMWASASAKLDGMLA